MTHLIKVIKKQNWILWGIIFIGLFFRVYKLDQYFGFGHEQDLQAFIAKDILVEHHPRLIGQETSIKGWFIGGLYYYLIAGFVFLYNMDPIGSLFPITMIAIATLVSVYYIVKKLYSEKTAYITSFIYATSMNIVILDRWPVPTQTTLLWVIWFYFVLIKIIRGEFSKVLPILIILIGLIWHIHIALIPLLILVPIAVLLVGRKKIKIKFNKYIFLSLLIFGILITPFILFEIRHGYSQIKSLTGLTHEDREIAILTGQYKLEIILENTGRVLFEPILYKLTENNYKIGFVHWGIFGFLGAYVYVFWKKVIERRELVLIGSWVLAVIGSLYGIQKALSEYYFNNLIIISLISFSVVLASWSKRVVEIILLIFLGLNMYYLFTRPIPKTEYLQKKGVIENIALHAHQYKFKCVGINYIGGLGSEYGYRYFSWLNDLHLVRPSNRVPVYSIVNPYTISEDEIDGRWDDIGVIYPANNEFDWSVCDEPSEQLLPLNGFVD